MAMSISYSFDVIVLSRFGCRETTSASKVAVSDEAFPAIPSASAVTVVEISSVTVVEVSAVTASDVTVVVASAVEVVVASAVAVVAA